MLECVPRLPRSYAITIPRWRAAYCATLERLDGTSAGRQDSASYLGSSEHTRTPYNHGTIRASMVAINQPDSSGETPTEVFIYKVELDAAFLLGTLIATSPPLGHTATQRILNTRNGIGNAVLRIQTRGQEGQRI